MWFLITNVWHLCDLYEKCWTFCDLHDTHLAIRYLHHKCWAIFWFSFQMFGNLHDKQTNKQTNREGPCLKQSAQSSVNWFTEWFPTFVNNQIFTQLLFIVFWEKNDKYFLNIVCCGVVIRWHKNILIKAIYLRDDTISRFVCLEVFTFRGLFVFNALRYECFEVFMFTGLYV